MKELTSKILENCTEKGGKQYIKCETLFKLADEFHVKLMEAGKICNKKHIKIKKCQLGCF